jgi:hypothetical protein
MSLASDEGAIFSSTSWMEEPLHFDLEQTTPSQLHIPQSMNVRSFSKGLEAIDAQVTTNALIDSKGGRPMLSLKQCALLKEAAANSANGGDDDLFSFTESADDMDDELPLRWEDELAQIVAGDSPSADADDHDQDTDHDLEPFSPSTDPKRDREVPLMDENTQEMLVGLPVKEFNIKTKALKLDSRALSHLKLLRKRLKNRQAAIRSRSKKENETLFLQRRVDELVRERDQQSLLIRQLQQRLAEVEKKVKSS